MGCARPREGSRDGGQPLRIWKCTTITFQPVPCGTELRIVQEGIPAMIPLDGCHVGWQQSLQLLALLVEAQVPA